MYEAPPPYEWFEDDTIQMGQMEKFPFHYDDSDIITDDVKEILLYLWEINSDGTIIIAEIEDILEDAAEREQSRPRQELEYASQYGTDFEGWISNSEYERRDLPLILRTPRAESCPNERGIGGGDIKEHDRNRKSGRHIKMAVPKKRKIKFSRPARKARKKVSHLFRSGTKLCQQIANPKHTVKHAKNSLGECSKAIILHPGRIMSSNILHLKSLMNTAASIVQKSEPISVFTIFQRLSLEMRDMIWEIAIESDPQVLEIWSDRRRATSSVQEYFTAIPIYFQVSIEARAAACRVYGINYTRPRFQYIPPQIFIRPALDSILIVNHEKSWGWLKDAPKFRRQNIQSLAITDTAFGHSFLAHDHQISTTATLNTVKRRLPELQEIIILPGGVYTGLFNFRYLGIRDSPNNLRDRSWRLKDSGVPTAPRSFVRKDVCKHKIFNHWIIQFFNSDDGSSGNVHLSEDWYWFARDLVYRVQQYGEVRIVRGMVRDRRIFVRAREACKVPRFRRCSSNNYSTFTKKMERGVCRLLGVSLPPWGAP